MKKRKIIVSSLLSIIMLAVIVPMIINPIRRPTFMISQGMAGSLFNAHGHFEAHHSWTFQYTPAGMSGFNSTSVTIGLLNAVGLDHRLSGSDRTRSVGINNPVPSRFFGVN